MEVVLHAVTHKHQSTNNMENCCNSSRQRVLLKLGNDNKPPREQSECIFARLNVYSRIAEGFFPKYRAWYRPMRPVGLISGAGPRGNFS